MPTPLPALSHLDENEARAIEKAFRLYDYRSSGKIPAYLAVSLCKQLGLEVAQHLLPPHTSLKDLLVLIDGWIPPPMPTLPGAMMSFTHLVGGAEPVAKQSKRNRRDTGKEKGKDKVKNNAAASADTSATKVTFSSQSGAPPSSSTSSVAIGGAEEEYPPFEGKVITTQYINDFMRSLGRPPVEASEAELMLKLMMPYDDCREVAVVPVADFAADMNTFARKSNAAKEYG